MLTQRERDAIDQVKDINMIDITAPYAVEVQIREDGKVVWVNVNGKCLFRACRIGSLTIDCPDPTRTLNNG